MSSHSRTITRAGLAALVLGAVALLTAISPAHWGVARAATTGQLRQQINSGQSQINSLAGAVGAASHQIGQLGGSINGLKAQIAKVQAQLDRDRAQLLSLRNQLYAARTRLAQLQAFEAKAESALAAQLVGSYEADRPDIVTVVLESTGFQDLLNKLAFAQRIRNQDVQIVTEVKAARRAVTAQAIKLGGLEQRQQLITANALKARDVLASDEAALVRQQLALLRYRARKAGQLASVRGQVASLRGRLNAILAAQAAAAAAAARRAQDQAFGAPSASGPPVSGGGFTFPLPIGAAGSPGTWSPDDGVDITAPGDTALYAVCSGTIVLHGIGGFGPWAPVIHCDSAVGGYSYVYYGHAGPAGELPVGTHVGAGAVIGSVGPGIVGISTGPHLEIGFADASGGPIGPGSAGTMMALLRGSY